MRPIVRGPRPTNPNGTPKEFNSYSDVRRDLIDRIGQHCSYCNQKLPASLAIEHIQPKALFPEHELEWENLLLACANCNSIKGDKHVALNDFLWPHIHNTHMAFEYSADGKVRIKQTLAVELQTKAKNLLELVGLQRYPDSPMDSDRRWKNRRDVYEKAQNALKLYHQAVEKNAELEFAQLLGLWASDNGFFSIWLQVFNNYPTVKEQIINSFKGTAIKAFNRHGDPLKRTNEL